VVEALWSAVRADPSMVELIPAELTAVIPELPVRGAPVTPTDRLAAQTELFASVLRFVSARAATAPVVMVLDDLHAADDGSVALLHYLARRTASVRLLIVATVRTGEPDAPAGLAPVLASLGRGGMLHVLTLSPVPREDLSDIASQALGGGEIDARVADELHDGSEGNPLFAVELARHMQAAARLVRTEGVWRFEESVVEPASVPTSIRALVDARVHALSPDGLRLVRTAAVMGRDIPLSWLQAALRSHVDVDESPLLDALDEAVARQLLEETGAGCRFPHALIRQAIEQTLSSARRRALHGQVGKALEELFRDQPAAPVDALAHHFAEAGLPIEAAGYLLQAGDAAEAVFAHQLALQRFASAIALLDEERTAEPTAAELRSAAWERAGDVHRLVGDVAQSQAAYLAALEGRGRSERMEIHRKVALASILAVDMATAAEHLQAARELLDGDAVLEARWLIAQALFEWHSNRLEEAVVTGERALELAEEAGAPVEVSQACEVLALANLPMGNWEEALRYERKRGTPDWSPEIAVAVDAHL
jgi:predicted ATPase